MATKQNHLWPMVPEHSQQWVMDRPKPPSRVISETQAALATLAHQRWDSIDLNMNNMLIVIQCPTLPRIVLCDSGNMSVVPVSEVEKYADRVSVDWGCSGSADKIWCWAGGKLSMMDAALKALNFDVGKPERALYGHGATITPGRKASCQQLCLPIISNACSLQCYVSLVLFDLVGDMHTSDDKLYFCQDSFVMLERF